MKKIILLGAFILAIPLATRAQNFILTINTTGITADSIHFQAFVKKKGFHDTIAVPFLSKVTIKHKATLSPGYYKILRDTNLLFDLLISEEKKQSLTVNIDGEGNIVFENSPENANCLAYNKKTKEFMDEYAELDRQYAEGQKSMPQYMLQTLAQNLSAQAEKIAIREEAYKQTVIDANPGTLLASIVAFSKELPKPAPEMYQRRDLIVKHYAEHAFDYYPFEDGRMANTPMFVERMREFGGQLLYISPAISCGLVDEILTKAQANTQNYSAFFRWLEKSFGNLESPYYNEELYLTMLRNAMAYNELEKDLVNHCKSEFNLHNKNLAGQQISDFHVLWSDGTESNLTDVSGEFILLYFQNPDCPTCTEVRGKMAENEDLNKAIASGRLKVVTIYFERDEELWRRYLKEKANPNYLHGWDDKAEIDAGNLYDLRAIPFMFLLDKDKKILKKDLQYNELSDYLKYYRIIE